MHLRLIIIIPYESYIMLLGFTTNTNLKIIIAIEDDILPNEVQLQKSKDEEVRVVLVSLQTY